MLVYQSEKKKIKIRSGLLRGRKCAKETNLGEKKC